MHRVKREKRQQVIPRQNLCIRLIFIGISMVNLVNKNYYLYKRMLLL